MVPLCSLVPLCPCQGSGFLVPLLTVLFGRSPLILCFSSPLSHQLPPLPSNCLKFPSITMSPSTTPIIPSVLVFPQAVLENGYDHLRDHSPNGGYMNYGVQVEGTEPTYFPVRGWVSGLWFSRPIFHFYFVKLTSLSLTFLILMTLTYFLIFLLS